MILGSPLNRTTSAGIIPVPHDSGITAATPGSLPNFAITKSPGLNSYRSNSFAFSGVIYATFWSTYPVFLIFCVLITLIPSSTK